MSHADDSKPRLEVFGGTDPSAYRLWKRRSQLLIGGLPTTVPEKKHGPRLMEFIKGEAEMLLECIPVEDLMNEGGAKRIWEVLDEKYLPQPRDLLQQALKNFFYDLQVKPSETYVQFLARFDAANRLLIEQKIELPSSVKGYMLLKKLKLDGTQESMVLTHTKSSLELPEIVLAVRGIFPEGRGTVKANKDVFQAENVSPTLEEVRVVEAEDDLQDVADLVAQEFQEAGGDDEEEALETFESYLEVRKKLREQRTQRGYVKPQTGGRNEGGDKWRLQGTVRGRLELLKSRTTCHNCQQRGHWKRECPLKGRKDQNSKPSNAASSTQGGSEVHASETAEVTEVLLAEEEMWKMFQVKPVSHRPEMQVAATRSISGSPTPESAREVFFHEAHVNDRLHNGPIFENVDESLGEAAVPDTACRRSLVGQYTLAQIESRLSNQGLKIVRKEDRAEFKFGNSQTLVTRETAIIPACLGGRKFLIRAAILPCSHTPLLLSKEFLRQLGCVIDLSGDRLHVFGQWFDLIETGHGHYGIPCFDFGGVGKSCCLKKEADIFVSSELKAVVTDSFSPAVTTDRHVGGIEEGGDRSSPQEPDASRGSQELGRRSEGAGQATGHGGGWSQFAGEWGRVSQGRQVWESPQWHVHGESVHGGQELHPVGQRAHQSSEFPGNAAPEALHPDPRRAQAGSIQVDHGVQDRQDSQGQDPSQATWPGPTPCGGGTQHGVAVCGPACWEPIDDRSGGRRCSSAAGGCLGPRSDGGGEGDRTGHVPHSPGCSAGCGATVGKEHVMSKKNRVKLRRNVDQWVDSHCGLDCAQCVDETEEAHDVFVVNLQASTDFAEVFSNPRILPVADKKGLRGLKSYDINQGWNFLDAEHRRKCRKEIEQYKPECVVVCPPCGPFSTMQACSWHKQDPKARARKMVEARVLLDFAMEICELQHSQKRLFIFEQPQGAASWHEGAVLRLGNQRGVFHVVCDQCMFGLKDPISRKFYRKRTKIMTNCEEMKRLERMCDHNHEHQKVEGQIKLGGSWVNRSRCAQVYPKELVEQIVLGYLKYRNKKGHEVLAAEGLQEDRTDLERNVRRCHVNLGHPSKERFLHMLKSAGASNKALEIAKRLTCSVCDVHKPYPSHAVSKHKRADGFNQQLNMDTFELPIYQGKTIKMLNMLCEGTGYQICVPLWKGANSKQVRKSYRKWWKRWAGSPLKVFTDGGTEFDKDVQQGFEEDGVYTEKTAAYSPWQAGYVERHGGIWKSVFMRAWEDCIPTCKREVDELVDSVNQSKNSMMRKHGYSPAQHVFGCDLRIPNSLLDDQPNLVFNSGVVHGDHDMIRSNEIRVAARRALAELDSDQKVRRALEHRPRTMRSQDLAVGDYVYYWRKYRDDGKKGFWRGPARVIGFYEGRSKIWVSIGNKILRCAPEQLRRLTVDQEAAIRFVSEDMVSTKRRLSERGAQVFTDISAEGNPPEEETGPVDQQGRKRQRTGETDDVEEAGVPIAPMDMDGLPDIEDINEPSTVTPSGNDSEEMGDGATMNGREDPEMRGQPNEQQAVPDVGNTGAASAYGPVRHGSLGDALRRSSELLDLGSVRATRTPYERASSADEALISEDVDIFESFLVQQARNDKRDTELRNSDIQESEWPQVMRGKEKEFEKLIKTGAIKVHRGQDAQRIRETVESNRILDSRFVKTRRNNPDDETQSEIKCRWVLKGFQDPDLMDLHRQSPTLSADAFAVTLQLLASFRWTLNIMDVEGAFLQGEPLQRSQGKLFASVPREGIPGLDSGDLIELQKCVYGLMDAPRKWWESITTTLIQLGMRQSELDPCVFHWFDSSNKYQLGGVLALHVDDMICGGNSQFHEVILGKLRQKYPFKHWKQGCGKFLGRWLEQNQDGSIVCSQEEYANSVQTVFISKERRKQKGDSLTNQELHQYRGIIGAANWLTGSTRPDLAAWTALLQQRISRATVNDLIEANRLVAQIRDLKHTKVTVRSIPIDKACVLVTSDASWANCDDLSSQAAYMVLFAEENIDHDQWAQVSPLRWKSWKLERKTQSTLGAELMGVSRSLAEGDWIRSLLAESLQYDYCLKEDQSRRQMFKMISVTDNKPIYDHVQGDGIVVRDKRMAIDMLVVRKDLKSQGVKLRWVDTRQMLVDSLTKMSADPSFLLFVLRFGRYICIQEDISLQWKAQERMLKRTLNTSKDGCVKEPVKALVKGSSA